MEKNKKGNILLGDVRMDTQTLYHANGDINIYPCAWESDKDPIATGRVTPKGRMTIEEDGTGFFKAYRNNSGSRYKHLFETANGVMKRTRKNLIVKMVLPLGIGRIKMIEALSCQLKEIINYISSLKENTIWS